MKWQTHCLQEAALARAWEFKSPLGHEEKLTDFDFRIFFQFSSIGNLLGNHLWKFLFFSTARKTLIGTYGIKIPWSRASEKKSPAVLTTGDHILHHRRWLYRHLRDQKIASCLSLHQFILHHAALSYLSRVRSETSHCSNRSTFSLEIPSRQTLLILRCNFCRYLFLFGI